MVRIILRAKTKPEVKPRGYWYERRDLLRRLYEKYRRGEISERVLMDSFKVDRMKPIVSAYHRMYGRAPEKRDSRQQLMPWGFGGELSDKR